MEEFEAWESKEIEEKIINPHNVDCQVKPCIYSSFRNKKLCWIGEDVLYKCFVDAYADHRPLILSPDMIWIALCQAFSHHINMNAEKYRSLIVGHSGKKDIIVYSKTDLLQEDADWAPVMNDFLAGVNDDAKGHIADTLVSDFSTTGISERIASQITMMDVVKSFYKFTAIYLVCGIPQITLEGTADDWEKILKKIDLFDKFDLQDWTSQLRPILREFVNASQGEVNASFWKSIVCKYHPKRLRGVSCDSSRQKTSKLDGWFLSLFPYDSDGEKIDSAYFGETNMLPEIVKVDMNFIKHNPITSEDIKYPLELIAGFVGVEESRDSKALRPKIGWMVKEADSEEDKEEYLKEVNESGIISIRVDKVPEILRSLYHIGCLEIEFVGKIDIPDWLSELEIENLHVKGEINPEEEVLLRQRFPRIIITSTCAS